MDKKGKNIDVTLQKRLYLPILMMIGYGCIVFVKVNLGTIFTSIEDTHKNGSAKMDSFELKPQVNEHIFLDNTQENTLLSVKSWTYLIFVLPAGFLADKMSPKAMISFMGLNYAFWTFVSPYSYFNFYALFVTLFMAGISESMVNPIFDSLVGKYVYVKDKALTISIYTAGVQISGALGSIIIPVICESSLSWSSIFYSLAILSLSWLLIFHFYWQKCMKKQVENPETKESLPSTVLIVPSNKKIFKLLTSITFISCVLCNITNCMLITLLQVYIPIFIQEVMGFPLVVNGIFNSSQYIVQLCVKLLWGGVIMNYLQNRFSQSVSCKISQVFASIFVAVPMILIANLFDHLNEFALLSLLCLIAVGMGIILNGFYTYLLSLSPEHTGLLSSIANILGTIGCVILPYFFVVLNVNKHTQWYIVFTVAGIGQAVTSLLFVLYAK